MEPRPVPPPWLPVVRPAEPPPTGPAPDPTPPAPHAWRRVTRSRRGAAGLAITAAALLLWPFTWEKPPWQELPPWESLLPWLAGLAAVAVLQLLRLDVLLKGWVPHIGGLVVVGGLMLSTTPWAWAVAASIGILLAGLAQLPWWRLAAVGALLCVVSGVGFGFATYRSTVEQEQAQAQANERTRTQIAEAYGDILPAAIQAVDSDRPDPGALCPLLTPEAEAQLVRARRAADCAGSVNDMHLSLSNVTERRDPTRSPQPAATEADAVIDGCATTWALAAGRELGRIRIHLLSRTERTYLISGFAACGVETRDEAGPARK